MGVDAAAGSSDVVDDIRSEVSETMAAAQQVLSHRFGAAVRLAAPEDLGGSGESTVIRVRVAATPFSLPRTLVVKRYGPPDPGAVTDAFVQEAVSYQLFTALASEERMCPEMFAHDGRERLVVLEDLGRSPTLADKLLGNDPRSAERALLSWARSLGRLHASTAGRERDFEALSRRLGRPRSVDPLVGQGRKALAELPDLLSVGLGVDTPAAVHERASWAARLVGSPRHRAFSPSDACPDNNVITSKGVRFLDFEGGCWRDVLLDAGYLRVPFPSCWCSYALPAGMIEAMVAAWRSRCSRPACWTRRCSGCGSRRGGSCPRPTRRICRSRGSCARRGAASRCVRAGSGWPLMPSAGASTSWPITRWPWSRRWSSGSARPICRGIPPFGDMGRAVIWAQR
jgi:hypothetical protein